MKRTHLRLSAFIPAMLLACPLSPAAPKVVREGADEAMHLDGLADPNRWGPSECMVSASKDLKAGGRPTLHMHIPVDHKGGEANYPIGWPRAYLKLADDEKHWGDFERFEFLLHATMTRPTPPRKALNLQIICPDRPRTTQRNLEELRLGQWVKVSVPIREIANVGETARLGLNISESDYRHGEQLDFRLGAFRLARAAEFGLAELAVLSRVLYADRAILKLRLDAVGPTGEVGKGLPLAVRGGGKTLHEQTVPVQRGRQTVTIDLTAAKLPPGTYEAVAFPGEKARQRAAAFRIVESPWQEAAK